MGTTRIFKNGNSLGLYIPSNYAKALEIEKGDTVYLELDQVNKELTIKLKKEASLYESEEFQNAVRDAVETILQKRDNKINGKG